MRNSTAKDYKAVLDELFFQNELTKNNFVGLANDGAKVLTGQDKGLVNIMRKECHFFDLIDTCHGLNLIIQKFLAEVDPKTINFINDCSNFFINSNKRLQSLIKIQEKRNLPTLAPIEWVKTRWLSLRTSLERLRKIWTPLKIFFLSECCTKWEIGNEIDCSIMDEPEIDQIGLDILSRIIESTVNIHDKKFLEAFNEETTDNSLSNDQRAKVKLYLIAKKFFNVEVRWKLKFLSFIVDYFNFQSLKFQSQNLEIQELKNICIQTIEKFSKICLKKEDSWIEIAKQLPKERESIKFNKISEEVKEQIIDNYFLIYEDLNTRMKLHGIGFHYCGNQEKCMKFAIDSFLLLIVYLIKYLPLKDEIVEALDCLQFKDAEHIIISKFLVLNQNFKLIPPEKEEDLVLEIQDAKLLFLDNNIRSSLLKVWSQLRDEP